MLLSQKDASLKVSYTIGPKKTDVSKIKDEKLGRSHTDA